MKLTNRDMWTLFAVLAFMFFGVLDGLMGNYSKALLWVAMLIFQWSLYQAGVTHKMAMELINDLITENNQFRHQIQILRADRGDRV